MSIESNSGTEYYAQSCGVPSDVGVDVTSNSFTGYYYNEPNDYILWGQDTYYPHVSTNIPTQYYYIECDRASDTGLSLSSNKGTAFYYSSAFNCVPFCSGLGGGTMSDVDAIAYVSAVELAGATVTSGQSMAIEDFIIAEKTASRWELHKRIWLPIWGVEAANNICMKSLSSGSYPAGATHATGYVQGNGTTQYFRSDVNMDTLFTNATAHTFVLLVDGPVTSGFCHGIGFNGPYALNPNGTSTYGFSPTARSTLGTNGVFSHMVFSNNHFVYNRSRVAGVSTGIVALSANVSGGFGVTATKMYFMGWNFSASGESLNVPSNDKFGIFGVGLNFDRTQAPEFTANLLQLWESCTGQVIPI